jgi:hypothetical protein
MVRTKLRIVISGVIGGVPFQGGLTWVYLHYLLGFKRLGHEVYFIEPIEQKVLRPVDVALEKSTNASYFQRVMRDFELDQRSALILKGTRQTLGLTYEQLSQVVSSADVLINASGLLRDETLTAHIPIRIYLDLDPAFNQLWHSVGGINMGFDGHTHFMTVGLNLGKPGCSVPTCGLHWIPTVQPLVLERWASGNGVTLDAYTTIANWRSYGSIEYDGVFYGQKVHSLRQIISLPRLAKEKFVLALSIHSDEVKDLLALKENCWHIIDPAEVASEPASFQKFIQASKGELGIAKSGYAVSRCGWFSDRSICYLASGKPVIAQETGFSNFLPTGEGLLAFETMEELLEGLQKVGDDYTKHSRAARMIAEEYFDSDKVLNRLLQQVGAVP